MTESHSISVHPPPEVGRGRRPSKVCKTLAPQKPYNQGQCGDMPPPFFLEKTGLIVSSHAKRVQSCGKLKHTLQNWQQFVIFTKALKRVLKCENDRESQLNIR